MPKGRCVISCPDISSLERAINKFFYSNDYKLTEKGKEITISNKHFPEGLAHFIAVKVKNRYQLRQV